MASSQLKNTRKANRSKDGVSVLVSAIASTPIMVGDIIGKIEDLYKCVVPSLEALA